MKFQPHEPSSTLIGLARCLRPFMFLTPRSRRLIKAYATVNRFGTRGADFVFDPDGTYSYETIHVGDHVDLGTEPTLLAVKFTIVIGNRVRFGSGVTICDDGKRTEGDRGVVIEDDVWVGANVTILGGVTIGRGSIIAASAVVTESVPPYSMVDGNPASVIRPRLTDHQITAHETALANRPRSA